MRRAAPTPNIQEPEVYKKSKPNRKRSRFERRKVFELKAKVDGITKSKHKLFAIFDDSRDVETGYSVKELATVLTPNHIQPNGEPTFYGQIYTKQMIRKWRKQILQSKKLGSAAAVVVPFAIKDEVLGWIYYNMQTRKEFAPVVKLGQDVINGIETLLKEFLDLLSMKDAKKEDINNEMREEIRRALLVIKRSKRSRL